MRKLIANWRKRHVNRLNFALHMVGIPACFAAAPVLLILRLWWPALAAFVGGYALQFTGHIIEHTPSGEGKLFRRILRRGPTNGEC